MDFYTPERKLKTKLSLKPNYYLTHTYFPATMRRLLNRKWTVEITIRAEASVHIMALGAFEMMFDKRTMNPI